MLSTWAAPTIPSREPEFSRPEALSDSGAITDGTTFAMSSLAEVPSEAPAAPSVAPVQTDENPGVVTLHWDEVPNATSYNVYRSTNENFGNAILLTTNATTANVFYDESANYGVTYWYWISAKNEVGETVPETAVQGSQRTKLWDFTAPGSISGPPAIAEDGTIRLAIGNTFPRPVSAPGRIIALDAEGKVKWEFPTEMSFASTPAVSKTGNTYAVNADGFAYAIDSTGALKWKVRIASMSSGPWRGSPAITGDQLIIIPGRYDTSPWAVGLVAYSEAGEKVWSSHADMQVFSSAVVSPDGTTYFAGGGGYPLSGAGPGYLYAFNRGGNRKWQIVGLPQVGTGYDLFDHPTILEDNSLVVSSTRRGLLRVFPDGRTNEFAQITPTANPVALSDGTMFIPEGAGIREFRFGEGSGRSLSVPQPIGHLAIASDNQLYISTRVPINAVGPILLTRSADGAVKTNLFGRGAAHAANFLPSGEVLVASTGGKLYAIAGPASLATNGWPTARADVRQSGNRSGPGTKPSPPVGIEATKGAFVNQVRLYWEVPNDFRSVEVWKAATTNFSDAILIATNISATEFRDNSVQGITNFYWLRGSSFLGTSDLSEPVKGWPNSEVNVRWIAPSDHMLSHPTLGHNGTIYTTGAPGQLYAWSPEGKLLWRVPDVIGGTGIPIRVGPDDKVHTWDGTNTWIVINPDGSVAKRTKVTESRADLHISVANDGTVYINGGSLRAFTPDGQLKWELPGTSSMPVSIGPDGNIFLISPAATNNFDELVSYSPTGVEQWRTPLPGSRVQSIALRNEGVVLDSSGGLRSFDFSGKSQWTAAIDFGWPQIISPEGNIYGTGGDTKIYTVDRDGKRLWSVKGRQDPLVSAGANVYVDEAPGIAAYSRNAEKLWTFEQPMNFQPERTKGFAMSPDGTFYFCTTTSLVALKTPDRPSSFSWSTVGGNMQRTGQLLSKPAEMTLEVLSIRSNGDESKVLTLQGRENAGAILEVSTDLKSWREVPFSQVSANEISVEVPISASQQFFRLRK